MWRLRLVETGGGGGLNQSQQRMEALLLRAKAQLGASKAGRTGLQPADAEQPLIHHGAP